jgi:cytolysin (calcineurin-like family phosphatase)
VDDWVIQLIALTPASHQTVTADVNGNFTFTNVSNGTYTVTPTKAGLTFTPATRSAIVNTANVTAINFTTP